MDVVGLVMRIEREYRVRLATEELAGIKRVGDLLDLMEAKLARDRTARAAATALRARSPNPRDRPAVQWSVAASPRATIATPAVIRSVPIQRAVPTSSRR